jgi:hypothetical protein
LGLFAGPLRRAGDIPVRAMEILRDYTKGFSSRFMYKDEIWTQLFHHKDALSTLDHGPTGLRSGPSRTQNAAIL